MDVKVFKTRAEQEEQNVEQKVNNEWQSSSSAIHCTQHYNIRQLMFDVCWWATVS